MNKVFIIGNLTKDPVTRLTSTGKKVASFSIAVNDGKDANGQDRVQFFNLSAWDKLADIIENYVKKGHKIAIVGSLQNRSWDKPDGTKGYATDILVREMEMLTSKMDAERINSTTQQGDTDQSFGGSKPSTSSSSKARKTEDEDRTEEEELPEIDVDSLNNIQMPF